MYNQARTILVEQSYGTAKIPSYYYTVNTSFVRSYCSHQSLFHMQNKIEKLHTLGVDWALMTDNKLTAIWLLCS